MQIIIENCSSPGAHFSANTNAVLLKIHEWIVEKDNPELLFIDFRRSLERDAKINDNNARNIYPLLKNGGLVEYQPGGVLETKKFFTNRGLAYINALQAKEMIVNSEEYTKRQKEAALVEVDKILCTVVYDTVELLLKNKELNYCESLKWFLQFLAKYGKINKQEFALMVYAKTQDDENWQGTVDSVLEQYRAKQVDIDVKVRVRNDQRIQASTGEKTRIEDISYFTAYSFYSGLINQTGLIRKVKDYFVVTDGAKEKLEHLLEV